jgi:hypothetical protein
MTADDRTRPAEEELHLGRVALNLGLVGPDELQLALDAQEELKAAGIHTLIGDVMLDLRLITAEQRERALTEQDRLLHQAGLLGRVRGAPTVGWLVAALVPAMAAGFEPGATTAVIQPRPTQRSGLLGASARPRRMAPDHASTALGGIWLSAGTSAATSHPTVGAPRTLPSRPAW